MNAGGATWALIHSPLVGPASLEPLSAALRDRGEAVVVPSLLGGERGWRGDVERVRTALGDLDRLVLVGHSGSGPLLPAIGAAVDGDVAAYVFVDAPLPPREGAAPLVPPSLRPQLEQLASDGLLPPWSSWFGEEMLAALVPDDAARGALEREMPRLPLAYFADDVPVPDGWDAVPCGYVLLTAAQYGAAEAEARERGWPTTTVAGATHLSTVTEPDAVARALLAVTRP